MGYCVRSTERRYDETWVSDDYQVLEIYAPANAGTEQLTEEIE